MGALDKSRIWKIAVVLIIVAFITLDIIYDRTFTESNNDWAIEAQNDGGDTLRYFSIVISSLGVFWVFIFLFFYIMFNKDIIFYMYIMTIFVGSLFVTYIMKALYYRARPYAIDANLHTECSCDPGMPSGHSATAAAAYIILFLVVYRHHLIYKRNTVRIAASIALIIISIVITVFVMLAMIFTGVHSYAQTIIGVWVSITVASLLTFEVWLRIMYKIRRHIKLGSVITLLVLIVYTIMMLFINSYEREKPGYWQFFDQQCPDCNNTWVYGQTRALSVVFFLPAFYFFFPFGETGTVSSSRGYAQRSPSSRAAGAVGQPYRVTNPESQQVLATGQQTQANPTNPQSTNLGTLSEMYEWRPDHRTLTRKQQYMRALWVLIALLPALILAAVYQFVLQEILFDSDVSKQAQAIVVFFEIGIIAIYAAWVITWFKDRIYLRKNLLTYNDRLYFDDLKTRIDQPEIITRPHGHQGTTTHVHY